jgi:hypothetical protein
MRGCIVRRRRLFQALACASGTLATSSAWALDSWDRDDPPEAPSPSPMPAPRGLQLGARIGYALPTGHLGGDATNSSTSLSELETAIVPIGVDVGFRLSPYIYLGGTGVWAPGISPNLTNNACQQVGVSCFRQDAQLRGEARFYFAPSAKVGGWLALGTGWELASFAQTLGSNTITATRTGPILPDMQLGFDIRRGATAVGFYFGWSLAMYLTQGLDPSSTPVATWIEDRAVHQWFTLGMRGSYGPW